MVEGHSCSGKSSVQGRSTDQNTLHFIKVIAVYNLNNLYTLCQLFHYFCDFDISFLVDEFNVIDSPAND